MKKKIHCKDFLRRKDVLFIMLSPPPPPEFSDVVDPLEAPGYHKLIKKPMDFGTIKRNLEVRLSWLSFLDLILKSLVFRDTEYGKRKTEKN